MKATGFSVLRRTRRYQEMITFYRDGLGMSVMEEWQLPGNSGALLSAGEALPDVSVEVLADEHYAGPEGPPENLELNIRVADPDAWHATLQAAGLPIAAPLQDRPWGHRNFGVVDPDGLKIWFYCSIKPAG